MRLLLLLTAVVAGIVATACGKSGRGAAPTTTTTPKPSPRDAVVHVYFCTEVTCPRPATNAQIVSIERLASASRLVKSVELVSKEEALELMRKKHPEYVAALSANPFPDALTVIPKRPEDVRAVADLFRADRRVGVQKVDYRAPKK